MAQETLQKFFEKLEGENKENNFKQTEIGLIPEDWKVVRLGEVVEFSRKPRNLRIRENDEIPFIPMELIPDSGKYASWLIKKYSEISSGTFIFKDDIIVAKITPSFENGKQALLTNLPMEFGYATTEVLAFHPKDEDIIREYIFEYLRLPKIRNDLTSKMEGTTGRKRLPRNALENLLIPLPPLPEQRKIVRVLDKIQQAIEIQDRIIEQAKRLKKSLMQKLFTEGLYGEEQKETEIGLIPKSWEVVRLGDYLELIKNGITKKQNKEGIGLPVTRIETISEGVIDVTKVGYINSLTPKEIEKHSLKIGDILFSHINSEPHLGKSAIYTGNPPTLIHGMNLLLIRAKKDQLDPFFLNNLFNWYRLRDIFIGIASRAVNQSSINQGKMKNLLISLPSLEEQKQIAHILSVVDKKIEVEQKRKQVLKELLKTMLHKLMSGEIRLKEVEI